MRNIHAASFLLASKNYEPKLYINEPIFTLAPPGKGGSITII